MSEMQNGPGVRASAQLLEMRDEDLIVLVQQGQRKAYDILVTRYKNRLYNFILKMVANPTEAEELTQETLIRAYIYADKYREIARFSTWLFTIATNLVRNNIRKIKRRPYTVAIDPAPDEDKMPVDPVDNSADPSEDIQRQELADLISEATCQIPEKYRIPFLLREIEQMSYEEIQEATGLKLGTVRSRINRARTRFRKAIKPLLKNETLLRELELIENRTATERENKKGDQ
ncbi:MAG: sigma-70 family RNA polymerase sigma factor [bacterium]|nr:sigma-70 family RNA polymerase sigma factor [bacterium]MCP4799834.1 sigma-70 family RNA polymerase sigma factor [bacterium]